MIVPPEIVLINPKYAHNVGAIIRACSCFGVDKLTFTGDRIHADLQELGRVPREERMAGYKDVRWCRDDRPFDHLEEGVVPVAVEFTDKAESLHDFEHPKYASYFFGAEDGGLSQVERRLCHRFVKIPSVHCVNLSAAVYLVLYDRALKKHQYVERWATKVLDNTIREMP